MERSWERGSSGICSDIAYRSWIIEINKDEQKFAIAYMCNCTMPILACQGYAPIFQGFAMLPSVCPAPAQREKNERGPAGRGPLDHARSFLSRQPQAARLVGLDELKLRLSSYRI